MITDLNLAGHDSELFSFLDPAFVEQLQQHPAANVPLWTFGTVERTPGVDILVEKLRSVSMWNTIPGCWAFRAIPPLKGEGNWLNYRGLTTNDQLIQVAALVLVRHFFVQGYTCALDDVAWIMQRADPGLDRLLFIRGRCGCSTASPDWMPRQAAYFDWALAALDAI